MGSLHVDVKPQRKFDTQTGMQTGICSKIFAAITRLPLFVESQTVLPDKRSVVYVFMRSVVEAKRSQKSKAYHKM